MNPYRALGVGILAILLSTCTACAPHWSERMRLQERVEYYPHYHRGERIAYVALGNSAEFGDWAPPKRPTDSEIHKNAIASKPVKEKPTLVFVHGLGASKYFWKDIATVMVHQHEFRAVLVDLLGHGDSDKPKKADYSPSAQGARLAQFVRDNPKNLFDQGIVLVGTSYGAVSSLEAVLELKRFEKNDRITPDVLGVFSVSAPAFYYPALEEIPDQLKQLENPPVIHRLGLLALRGCAFEEFLAGAVWHDERILEADRKEIRSQYGIWKRPARRAVRLAAVALIRELSRRRCNYDRFKDLPCPVMVVGGKQDEVVPNWVQYKLWENTDWDPRKAGKEKPEKPLLIPDCGHAVAQDQPTVLVESLTEFLIGLNNSAG